MIQIEDKIKELYGTKTKFCEAHGYKSRDLASKIRTVNSKIEWLNNFIRPLNLEIRVTEAQEKEKKSVNDADG